MNNYSFLQKLFHKVILNNDNFLNISYDLEKYFSKKNLKNFVSQKLFITGYARSGTTILLNNLYQTGKFRSFTYDDMPFIMSPRLKTTLLSLLTELTIAKRTRTATISVMRCPSVCQRNRLMAWRSTKSLCG